MHWSQSRFITPPIDLMTGYTTNQTVFSWRANHPSDENNQFNMGQAYFRTRSQSAHFYSHPQGALPGFLGSLQPLFVF